VTKLFANPTVRLAGRALVAALLVAITQIHSSDGQIAWTSLAVGAGLAFCEVFTPLNSLVGVFKTVPRKT
jgi:hypothetical protein